MNQLMARSRVPRARMAERAEVMALLVVGMMGAMNIPDSP